MKFSRPAALLVGIAAGVQAAPSKRQASGITDVDILNYALTLEHLESTFYNEALTNITQAMFTSAGYNQEAYNNLMQVRDDEAMHVSFLTSAITAAGGTPVAACSYDFGNLNVATFLATAAVLEGVGTAAYLGAAGDIVNKAYLGAAGSILTIEARHTAYLRSIQNKAPIAQPFETALDFNEVYTLAAPFITSCPSTNPTLPVKAFPMLSVDMSNANSTLTAGSTVTLDTNNFSLMPMTGGSQLYAAFIGPMGPIFAPATDASNGQGTKFSTTIPEGVNGQAYVVLTGCDSAVTDDTVAAGPAIVEIDNPTPYNQTAPAMSMSNSTSCSTSGFNATGPGAMTGAGSGTGSGMGMSGQGSMPSGSPSSSAVPKANAAGMLNANAFTGMIAAAVAGVMATCL